MFGLGQKEECPLPELPGVCLTCGAQAPLAPAKFTFRYTSTLSVLLTVLALFVGILYTHHMVYRMKLPVCGVCSGRLRRGKNAVILSLILVLPSMVLGAFLSDIHWLFFLLPLVQLLGACLYYVVEHTRGTPKTARIDNDRLVLSVPGCGEVTVYERPPKGAGKAKRQAAAAAPLLNRSICDGCGFINFSSATECKKCRAPLAQGVAV